MTESGIDFGLDDASRAGVFFVTGEDIATLDMAARDAGLLARRIDLRGCTGKAILMLRLASALDFPAGSGRNWDALSDQLRDGDETSFDTLLEVLDEAAQAWADEDVPFWAFLALPEDEFEQTD